MPMRIGGKYDIQTLENLETSHQINCQIFLFIYLSTHQADFFKDRNERVVLPLYPQCQAQCLAWSNHSKIFTQKSTQDTSMMTPRCWVWFTERCGNLETVSSLVRRSLQTNNHAIILNILKYFSAVFSYTVCIRRWAEFCLYFFSSAKVHRTWTNLRFIALNIIKIFENR